MRVEATTREPLLGAANYNEESIAMYTLWLIESYEI